LYSLHHFTYPHQNIIDTRTNRHDTLNAVIVPSFVTYYITSRSRKLLRPRVRCNFEFSECSSHRYIARHILLALIVDYGSISRVSSGPSNAAKGRTVPPPLPAVHLSPVSPDVRLNVLSNRALRITYVSSVELPPSWRFPRKYHAAHAQ
jgi:hypothetical protein